AASPAVVSPTASFASSGPSVRLGARVRVGPQQSAQAVVGRGPIQAQVSPAVARGFGNGSTDEVKPGSPGQKPHNRATGGVGASRGGSPTAHGHTRNDGSQGGPGQAQ